MSVIAKWDGTGVADGTVLTTTTGAAADTKFENVAVTSPGTLTVQNSGLHPPRVHLAAPNGATGTVLAHFSWLTGLGGGTFPQHAVRFYLEMSGLATGNSAGIMSIRNTANEFVWWLDTSTAGLLRLRNLAGTAVASSQQPIPLNTVLRIEATYNNGVVTVYLYRGDSQIPIETLSGTGFDAQVGGSGIVVPQQVRWGSPNNADKFPPHVYWSNMAFANTADLVGPVVPGPSTQWSYWDGTKETSLAEYGLWNGSTLQYYTDNAYIL